MFSLRCLLCFVFAFFGLFSCFDSLFANPPQCPAMSSGRIEIRFTIAVLSRLNMSADGSIGEPSGLPALDNLLHKTPKATLTPLFTHDPVSRRNPNFIKFGLDRFYVFESDELWNSDQHKRIQFCDQLAAIDGIEFAIPIGFCHALHLPNDFAIANRDSWGLDSMHCPQAWNMQRGDDEILVASIDTGIDYLHEDLAGNIAINAAEDIDQDGMLSEQDNDLIDNDFNGFVDDVIGWDFQSVPANRIPYPLIEAEDYGTPDNNPMDVHTHGTHVAGILASRTNNGVGVASASYNVKTLAMRAGYAYRSDQHLFGDGLVDDFARATQYVANREARVVSFSYGYDYPDSAWQAAVNYLAANDALIFGAAGNNDNASYIYPAMFENVIAVAALNRGNFRAWFSSYGSWVDIAAPGVSIWSTVMPNMINTAYYTQYPGTSMATPNAAAVAALLWSKNPALSAIDIRTAMYQTATDLTQINPGYMLGAGGVNASAALETIPVRPLRLLTPSSIEDTLWIGCSDTIRWVDQNSTSMRIQCQTNYPYGEWMTLFAATPNDGWEPWTPTGTATKLRFRILSNTDFRWQDRSDNDLPLATKALVLTEPNNGTKLFGAVDTIRWAKRGVDRIRIEWNRYYPLSNWELIASQVDATTGKLQWIIPRVGTNNARIKITDESDTTRFDISNASFSIRSAQIQIANFATKDTVYTGIPFTLRWSSFGVTGNLTLDINTSYPTGDWIRYDGNVPNCDSLRITLPHTIYGETTRLRLRSNVDTNVTAIHLGNLRIVRPWIQITNPNGGENWPLFQSCQVRWLGDHIAPVRVQIARDYPTNQWNDISIAIANNGSYWWGAIPPWSSRCRIRVFFRDFPTIGDTTDYNFSLSGVGTTEQSGLLPDCFTVETPYPNPANGEVSLRFAIPTAGSITVDLFDLQGRQIERLSNQWYRGGYHAIRWNPAMTGRSNFTSGVYFVKIAYKGQTIWGKGVILR